MTAILNQYFVEYISVNVASYLATSLVSKASGCARQRRTD